jgi:hypothetical protein
MRDWYCYNAGTAYERLHQYSVCDPALEILAEVHEYIQWKTDGNLKTTTAFLEKKTFLFNVLLYILLHAKSI